MDTSPQATFGKDENKAQPRLLESALWTDRTRLERPRRLTQLLGNAQKENWQLAKYNSAEPLEKPSELTRSHRYGIIPVYNI